jgi:hypothetical protein
MFRSGSHALFWSQTLTAENGGYLIEATSLLLEGHSAKVREARDEILLPDMASNAAVGMCRVAMQTDLRGMSMRHSDRCRCLS